MMINLADAERDTLMRLIDESLADLRTELRRTRTPDFHDKLVEQGRILKDLLTKIRAA